jgi:hypothetical protein
MGNEVMREVRRSRQENEQVFSFFLDHDKRHIFSEIM